MSVPESDHPEILLLGGGHANLLAAPLLRKALPDARILLIDAAPDAVYSGMIPGLVAGADQTETLARGELFVISIDITIGIIIGN